MSAPSLLFGAALGLTALFLLGTVHRLALRVRWAWLCHRTRVEVRSLRDQRHA